MKERRRARRYRVDIELKTINGKNVPGARLLDLSANGAKVESTLSPRLKEHFTITLLLPGIPNPCQVNGSVVWKKPAAAGLYVVGVQFYQNNWELDKWLRQQPRNQPV